MQWVKEKILDQRKIKTRSSKRLTYVARKAWTYINQVHSQLSPVFYKYISHISQKMYLCSLLKKKINFIPLQFKWNKIESFHLISNTSSACHQLKEVLAPMLEMGFLLVLCSSLESNVTCLATLGLEAALTGASSSS